MQRQGHVEGEPASWDSPVTAGTVVSWSSYGPFRSCCVTQSSWHCSGLGKHSALPCVRYAAVNIFSHRQDDRSQDVRDVRGLTSPSGSVTWVHANIFRKRIGSARKRALRKDLSMEKANKIIRKHLHKKGPASQIFLGQRHSLSLLQIYFIILMLIKKCNQDRLSSTSGSSLPSSLMTSQIWKLHRFKKTFGQRTLNTFACTDSRTPFPPLPLVTDKQRENNNYIHKTFKLKE